MDAIKCLLTRRSIRKYTDQPVPRDVLKGILEAAFQAPTAFEQRPWHYVVVRDRKVLGALAREMEGCEWLASAPAAIMVCGDESLQKFPGYWTQDCSAAAQNIQLAAHAHGLGSCWIAIIGVPPREKAVRKHLKVPDSIAPFALMSLGHPGETPESPGRYDAARVHDQTW